MSDPHEPGIAPSRPVIELRRKLLDGLVVDIDPTRLDLEQVHEWLSTDAYWAIGRPIEAVRRAVAGSVSFGVYAADGKQVGYARLVTDGATFGWLCDVYIDRAARGRGIGTALALAIVDAVRPLGMKRLMLSTGDAHDVYAKAGFVVHPNPEQIMLLEVQRPCSSDA